MDAGAILDIHFVADADKIYIASYHCIEPDAALIAHDHITDNGSIGSYIAIVSELRVFIFYGEYDWHVAEFKV
jgi:hypothetical protein